MLIKLKSFKAIKLYRKNNLKIFGKIFSAAFIAALLMFNVAFASEESEILNIDLKTSHYMKLDKKITRLAVGNPEVVTVLQVPNSPNEFLIIAKGAGTTTLFVWTVPDVMYKTYVINVSPEDKGLAKMIRQAIGLPSVHVKAVSKSNGNGNGNSLRILLTGTVRNQYERNWAVQTARLFAGGEANSSLSVGSGVDMSMNTQNAVAEGSVVITSGDIGGSKIQNSGEVIDLLHMLRPTQIRFEAQVIAIRPQDRQELGIRYGNDPLNAPGVFAIGESYGIGGTPFRTNPWRWAEGNHDDINVSISALVTKNKAKILSRPSITTMSGEEAVIQVGGEIPYQTQNSNGVSNTSFKQYGIILQLKPVADAEDRIVSTIHAEVSNISGESANGLPILEMRRADSVITVRSGSTMVIGGLMDSSESKTVSKFPLLGDIPILGEFFKYTSKSKDKQELIILVTPYLVDESDLSRARMSDSMQDLYNKGLEEKNNLNNVELNNSDETDDKQSVDENIGAP